MVIRLLCYKLVMFNQPGSVLDIRHELVPGTNREAFDGSFVYFAVLLALAWFSQ